MTPLAQKFQGVGGGGLIGRTIHAGGGGGLGMDIFWNHTICICRVTKICLIGNNFYL